MAGQRKKPDFIIDPSGKARDVRHMKYESSQVPPRDPPKDQLRNWSTRSSQKPKKTPFLIPIPIGLICFLLLTLFRHFVPAYENVNTFNSELTYSEYQSGNSAFFRDEYDEAIMHYNLALASESDVGDVYNARGLAYQAKGDNDQALADFEQALKWMPESAMVYNNRALSYYAMGNYQLALVDLDKAIEIKSGFGKAYYNRGIIYHAMGDYDQAIVDLGKALEFSYDWSTPIPELQSDTVFGSIADVENQLETMRSYADQPSIYYQRGLAYLAKEDYESAISDLDQTIRMQPNFIEAYYDRAVAYLAIGNLNKAKYDCQTMLEMDNNAKAESVSEDVQTFCSLLVSGFEIPILKNKEMPTKSAFDVPTSKPPAQMAVYNPQPGEMSSTSIWDNTKDSCEGQSYNMWGSPGTYIYESKGGRFLTVVLELEEAIPDLGVSGPGSYSLSKVRKENVKTNLGTFQATLLRAERDYNIYTGRHDSYQGTYKRNEWYVCGYGLIKLTSSDTGTRNPGNYSYVNSLDLILISFTPLTTNEARIRYILTDIQLDNVIDAYHANISDEETAEALRRWDAGIRVENIEEFERQLLDEKWQIVYVGTKNPIIGKDVILTSDGTQ